jgi:hypothetical protein
MAKYGNIRFILQTIAHFGSKIHRYEPSNRYHLPAMSREALQAVKRHIYKNAFHPPKSRSHNRLGMKEDKCHLFVMHGFSMPESCADAFVYS